MFCIDSICVSVDVYCIVGGIKEASSAEATKVQAIQGRYAGTAKRISEAH